MRADYVILGSVLSEKSVGLSENKVYTLKVNPNASKYQIKAALKDVFGVDAIKINTHVTVGKTVKRSRSKKGMPITVRKAKVKKAFVYLKDGQTLQTIAIDNA